MNEGVLIHAANEALERHRVATAAGDRAAVEAARHDLEAARRSLKAAKREILALEQIRDSHGAPVHDRRPSACEAEEAGRRDGKTGA